MFYQPLIIDKNLVSAQAWTRFVTKLYHKELKTLGASPSQEDIHEHFKEQLNYYLSVIGPFLESKQDDGKFPQVVKKVVQPFVKLVCCSVVNTLSLDTNTC